MSLAADHADLSNDPEFGPAVAGYPEWEMRLAIHNSQPGADVALHAPVPVPHWGWGVGRPTSSDGNSCVSGHALGRGSRRANGCHGLIRTRSHGTGGRPREAASPHPRADRLTPQHVR